MRRGGLWRSLTRLSLSYASACTRSPESCHYTRVLCNPFLGSQRGRDPCLDGQRAGRKLHYITPTSSPPEPTTTILVSSPLLLDFYYH